MSWPLCSQTVCEQRSFTLPIAWLTRQASAREDLYHDLADLIIDVDALPMGQVADTILQWLGTSDV